MSKKDSISVESFVVTSVKDAKRSLRRNSSKCSSEPNKNENQEEDAFEIDRKKNGSGKLKLASHDQVD